MKKFAAIFDMDGVIADTNPYHAKAFEQFFDKYQIEYSQEEFEQHMYGKHNSYIMRHFFGRALTDQEVRDYENEKEGLFRDIYREYATPIPGLIPFLDELKSSDFALGVATSAPKANMDLILNTLDIRSYFASTMSSENVTAHKPDPEVYLQSAKNLQTQPLDCLVFEDSFSGISAGLAANMKVVGLLTSHRKDELPPCELYIDDYYNMTADLAISLLTE